MRLYGVAGFGMLSTCAQAFALELQAFSVLPFQQPTDLTELRNYARDHLAHFKCPQPIQFVFELPKTATGKVQKYILRGKPAISNQ